MAISSALGSSALLPAGLGFRNVLINGDFKVWQRGTTKAMATGSGTGFIADRWTGARAGYAAGGTVSRQTASLDGFQYCSRVQRDSGNTSTAIAYYFQTLESVTSIPLANKPVVYSFYIRAGANFSGSIVAKLYSGTATDQVNYPDGGITGSATVVTSTLSLTTSWQRVVLYGNVGASATQLFTGFEWTPSGTAGAADYYEITGVQVEQNYQPTPFEQRPIGVELALCQRYFWRNDVSGNTNARIGVGQVYTTNCQAYMIHPVPMRTAPTSISTSTTAGNFAFYNGITAVGASGVPTFDAASSFGTNVSMGLTSSMTTSGGAMYRVASPCWIEVSAEL
jgi:hypothetical protein